MPVEEQLLVPAGEQLLVPVKEQLLVPGEEQLLVPVKEQLLVPVEEQLLVPVEEQRLSLGQGLERRKLYSLLSLSLVSSLLGHFCSGHRSLVSLAVNVLLQPLWLFNWIRKIKSASLLSLKGSLS